MQSPEARLTAIEARIDALEQASLSHSPDVHADSNHNGTVSFAGDITLPTGMYTYAWARPTAWITDQPWDAAIARVAALAHPVRGAILRHLLVAPASVTELVESDLVSSTGTAYHHLKELQAAGWVHKQDGVFKIPPARIVPLMAMVIAGEDH